MKKYILEKESEWILPENIKKSQKQHLHISDNDNINLENDFGSYHHLRYKGLEGSLIHEHNAIDKDAYIYSKILKRMVKNFKHQINVVGDMGCGAGFITDNIKRIFPEANVFGYDISIDAIEYAKTHFKNITFQDVVITPETIFNKKFDVIHARAFYPFVRTNSIDFILDYINMFLDHLIKNGLLCINHEYTPNGIINVIEEIKEKISSKANCYCFIMPSIKIYSLLPNLWLSRVITVIIKLLLNRPNIYMIIIKKLH